MSDFSTFFPSGGGGGAADIGQFYLPGSLETYPDIHTATDGKVYLKTGATIPSNSYPLAKPLSAGIYTVNSIPGFNTSSGAGCSFLNLPGENKFLAIYSTSYTPAQFFYTIIDRANPPASIFAPTTSTPVTISNVDSRYYSPAVRDQVSGNRYSFSSTQNNWNSWYANGMLQSPKIGQVTGSWPNYTAVGTQVTVNFSTAGILPGGTRINYSALFESVYRPTVDGATSSQGFITYRVANVQSQNSYMTFSLEDGSTSYVQPTTQLTSGYPYTSISQLDSGDIYLNSRYPQTPYGPALQKLNSNTFTYSGPVNLIPAAFYPTNSTYGGYLRGSPIIQGSTPTTFYSFINTTSVNTVTQINEINLSMLLISPARYALQQDAAGSSTVVPTENQILYWRIG